MKQNLMAIVNACLLTTSIILLFMSFDMLRTTNAVIVSFVDTMENCTYDQELAANDKEATDNK